MTKTAFTNLGTRPQPSEVLTQTIERLSLATSMNTISQIVTEAARLLTSADGASFVLRDGDQCYYADENAISPLWKGKRFPQENCISGWAMRNRQVVILPDVFVDGRIPKEAYRPTFVKSLCITPIREQKPLGVIGTYWSTNHTATAEEVRLLQMLSNNTAIAIENIELQADLSKKMNELDDHEKEMEIAVHSMAHDLRNPLSSMLGLGQLLQVHARSQMDERSQKYLDLMVTTGFRASEQINRMIAIFTMNHHNLKKQEVSLNQIGNEVASLLKQEHTEQKVLFMSEPNLQAHADPFLMHIVIENLLSNAFKYSSKKSEAVVRMGLHDRTSSEATFFVKDNGDGFDNTQAEKLFKPLARLHENSEFQGTGLGLASVARIIQMHGGSVRAEGKKFEGATFYFSIPNQ